MLRLILLIQFLLGSLLLTGLAAAATPAPNQATAIFAGGCFWCVEAAFDGVKGVISTTSGYTGGRVPNPTYQQVSGEQTGHFEAVQVAYDPTQISYERLLNIFWHNIDPLDPEGQFCDKGSSYRSAIFYNSPEQKKLAEQSKQQIESSKRFNQSIVTLIKPASTFYKAEEYHQDYHQKNPIPYSYYRFACGRDLRLRALWGDAATKETSTLR